MLSEPTNRQGESQRPFPIRLVFDTSSRRLLPLSYGDEPGPNEEDVPMNAPSPYGGIRVWLYDTLQEALAFVDATDAMLPHYEYSSCAHEIKIADAYCGVAIVEIDWMGDQTLFRDHRGR